MIHISKEKRKQNMFCTPGHTVFKHLPQKKKRKKKSATAIWILHCHIAFFDDISINCAVLQRTHTSAVPDVV